MRGCIIVDSSTLDLRPMGANALVIPGPTVSYDSAKAEKSGVMRLRLFLDRAIREAAACRAARSLQARRLPAAPPLPRRRPRRRRERPDRGKCGAADRNRLSSRSSRRARTPLAAGREAGDGSGRASPSVPSGSSRDGYPTEFRNSDDTLQNPRHPRGDPGTRKSMS